MEKQIQKLEKEIKDLEKVLESYKEEIVRTKDLINCEVRVCNKCKKEFIDFNTFYPQKMKYCVNCVSKIFNIMNSEKQGVNKNEYL